MVSTMALATKAELRVRQTRGVAKEDLIVENTEETITWLQIVETLVILLSLGIIVANLVMILRVLM